MSPYIYMAADPRKLTLQIMPIWNKINATWITDLCFNRSRLCWPLLCWNKKGKTKLRVLSSLVLQNVIAMHAGKVLYSSCAGKHGARYKTNFITLKAVLNFQTLMLATLGKWATTHDRVTFLVKNCSWTLLPGSTWLQTPITRSYHGVAFEVTEHILLL